MILYAFMNKTPRSESGREAAVYVINQLYIMARIEDIIRAGLDKSEVEINKPSQEERENLQELLEHVVNPLLAQFEGMEITSGYRCYSVNRAAGGVPNSQHTKGQAVDVWYLAMDRDIELSVRAVYDWVVDNLVFDQMIIYDTFIHISYTSRRRNRMQVLRYAKYHNQDITPGIINR